MCPPFTEQNLKTPIRPSLSWLDRCGCWLIDRRGMAEFLGVRLPQVQYLHNSGRIPRPVQFFCGPSRYVVPELRDWVRMGCPRIHEWIELRGVSGSLPSYKWGIAVRRFEGESPRLPGPLIELREV